MLRREITKRYGYERTLEAIRASHRFDVTCQGTVPTALISALESTSLEDAIQNAASLGGGRGHRERRPPLDVGTSAGHQLSGSQRERGRNERYGRATQSYVEGGSNIGPRQACRALE